jgi:hypothetical protein
VLRFRDYIKSEGPGFMRDFFGDTP